MINEKDIVEVAQEIGCDYEIENGYVNLGIRWGDWKHSHLYADHLMSRIGGVLVSEQVTEENGSDCYSAIRTYAFE